MSKFKYILVLTIVSGLIFAASCFQRLQTFEVKTDNEGIIFTHPKMEEALKENKLLVFGEITVSRRDAEGKSVAVWNVQSTSSGFSESSETMNKSYIVYGEIIPQTRIFTEAKPLDDGKYQAAGIVGIYDKNRKLLDDLNLTKEFTVKTDEAGNKTISQ